MVDCAETESVNDLPLSCSSSDKRSCTSAVPSYSLAVVPYDETVIPDFHRLERKFLFANGHHVTILQNWADGGVSSVVWDAVSGRWFLSIEQNSFVSSASKKT